MARGEEVDMAQFCAMASTLVRLSNRIGLGRSLKNVTPVPTLSEYLQVATDP
jgi:hypothetical protein